MTIETAQAGKLNHAVAELRKIAQMEGIETLFMVAIQHRQETEPHHFVPAGAVEGCQCCAIGSLGRFIGSRMSEMMIAELLDAIQSAYAERTVLEAYVEVANAERELVVL